MSRGVFDFNKFLYTRATPSAISNFWATRENKRESAAWVNVIWRFNAPSALAYKVYARSISAQPSVRNAVTCYRRTRVAMQSVNGTIVDLSSPFFLRFRSGSIPEYQSFNQSRRNVVHFVPGKRDRFSKSRGDPRFFVCDATRWRSIYFRSHV